MALYFLSIIVTTLAAVTILFYFTVGRPLARDIHAMLRSHVQYLASMIKDSDLRHEDGQILIRSLDRFTDYYGFDIVLFDRDSHRIMSSSSLKDKTITLTDAMIERMKQQELFVQSSHFGRPLIYMVPVVLDTKVIRYLYITKHYPENRKPLAFLSGLALIGCLLILAVYPLSKGITRPVTRLTRDLEKIAAGQFNEIPDSTRKDEIGTLIRGYRSMSQSLNIMIQSKKQLLADISHELCSPLARIRVGTELIKDISSSEKSGRYLENIENDIASMDHLIKNLTVFSQMNLPGFPLNRKPVSPHDLVTTIQELYLPTAERQQIRLSVRNVEDSLWIIGDFERLKQVFTNLMDNALRYSNPGCVIGLGAEENDKRLCFFVEDQGPGVPDTDTEKIFDPFYRVDFSRNKNLGGSGLGLAISKKIIELHGGTLGYSRNHERTRFTFCLETKRIL